MTVTLQPNVPKNIRLSVRKNLGWTNPITFTAEQVPPGLSVAFTPSSTSGPNNVDIIAQVTAALSISPGNYSIVFSGTPAPGANGKIAVPFNVPVPTTLTPSVVNVSASYANPARGTQNVQMYATATSSRGTINTYQWYIDNNPINTGFNPSPVLTMPGYGTYTVSLTVVDSTGVSASTSVLVTTVAAAAIADANISITYAYNVAPLSTMQQSGQYTYNITGTWDTNTYGFSQSIFIDQGNLTLIHQVLNYGSTVQVSVGYPPTSSAQSFNVRAGYDSLAGGGIKEATYVATVNAKAVIVRDISTQFITRGEVDIYTNARNNVLYPDSTSSSPSASNGDYEWYWLGLSKNSTRSYIIFQNFDTSTIPSNYTMASVELIMPVTYMTGLYKADQSGADNLANDPSSKVDIFLRKASDRSVTPMVLNQSIISSEVDVATLPFLNISLADGSPYTPGTIGSHTVSLNYISLSDLKNGLILSIDTQYAERGASTGNFRAFKSLPTASGTDSSIRVNARDMKVRVTYT